jgi:hypothetical protein
MEVLTKINKNAIIKSRKLLFFVPLKKGEFMKIGDKLYLALSESHYVFGKRIGIKDITWPEVMPAIAASGICLAMVVWAACQ